MLRVTAGRFTEALFRGDITALEWRYGAGNRREFVVCGYDALYRLGQRHSMRAFADLTPADLARQLSGELELDVSAPPRPALGRACTSTARRTWPCCRTYGALRAVPVGRGATLHLVSLAGDDSDLLPAAGAKT